MRLLQQSPDRRPSISVVLKKSFHYHHSTIDRVFVVVSAYSHSYRGNRSKRTEERNNPAHKLLECVQVKQRDHSTPARCFEDFEIVIDRDKLPQGVELIERI